MKLSRIQIQNFRNFSALDLRLDGNAVIVGENRIGKSNLLYALGLILDPTLPDSARQLRLEDFWDGLDRPLTRHEEITVSVELTDFEDDENQFALLSDYLIDDHTARLTYVFQPLSSLDDEPQRESDYEFFLYGGPQEQTELKKEVRRGLPLDLLPALRDAEGDIGNWRRSPLRPLLDAAASGVMRQSRTGRNWERSLTNIGRRLAERPMRG